MCRTVHAVLQTAICGIQMLVRVFMTVILMLENLIRMILQTLYNFVSFLLQMLSLIPICIVFLLTARLKCFMCGGGGPCPVNRGGACDCIMSALAIIILFFIFRATGVLDKIFYSLGYAKAKPQTYRFVPTPGDITECSRNDTDYTDFPDSTVFNDTQKITDLYTSTYLSSLEQDSPDVDSPDKNSPDISSPVLSSPDQDSYDISSPEYKSLEPTASNTPRKLEEIVYDSITFQKTLKTSVAHQDHVEDITEATQTTYNFLRDLMLRSSRRWPKEVSFMI